MIYAEDSVFSVELLGNNTGMEATVSQERIQQKMNFTSNSVIPPIGHAIQPIPVLFMGDQSYCLSLHLDQPEEGLTPPL